MRVIFDKYGKIVGTPTTDDYWGQGDNLTIFLEAQFLDDNDQPIVFTSNQYLEVVVERPDGQVSPALLMTKTNDSDSHLTVGKLTITNWITEVAGKIKFNVRLKETDLNDVVTTKVTGICYRVIGQAIDPADQTITDAEYSALLGALAGKEDVANKSAILEQNSNVKYPTHKLLYEYLHDRIILITTEFANMASLEAEFSNGTGGTFNVSGLYSVKVGDGSNYDRVLVLVHAKSGNYGYHATIFNGSFIEMLTGTIQESGPDAGHLSIPATQNKYDLSKIGFADNGTLSGLSTTQKASIVAAINELYTFLGSTSGSSLVGFDTTTKDVVHCLNEAREMIRQIVSGGLSVGSAVNATNATNDEDGNQIKATYAKKAGNNDFSGNNSFSGYSHFTGNVLVETSEFAVDGETSLNGGSKLYGTNKVEGILVIPLAAADNQAARLDQVNDVRDKFLNGTYVASKASKDDQNNKIDTTYGHSITILADPDTYQYIFQLKDAHGTVLNQESIDLPIESVVVGGEYVAANQKIVLTLENGNTIDIPVGALISGLQTEITNQNKLSSDLVDDTNHTNKFVTASEKAQITQNATDIAALDARMDDYSYAEMVYDADDESITVTGLALSYDGDDEEIIIIR